MPRISSFYGIVISMYWDEGNHRVPHFHAQHGEDLRPRLEELRGG
jgi:hypothetical protein